MSAPLKAFACTSFEGHWAVPVAAVVFANGPDHAADLLQAKLDEIGLPQAVTPNQMAELSLDAAGATILSDGEY